MHPSSLLPVEVPKEFKRASCCTGIPSAAKACRRYANGLGPQLVESRVRCPEVPPDVLRGCAFGADAERCLTALSSTGSAVNTSIVDGKALTGRTV